MCDALMSDLILAVAIEFPKRIGATFFIGLFRIVIIFTKRSRENIVFTVSSHYYEARTRQAVLTPFLIIRSSNIKCDGRIVFARFLLYFNKKKRKKKNGSGLRLNGGQGHNLGHCGISETIKKLVWYRW